MKFLLIPFFLLLNIFICEAQVKKFGYELRVISSNANANNIFYPEDQFSIEIVPINKELWDGRSRYFSLFDYIGNDNVLKLLLPDDNTNPIDFSLRDYPLTIENVRIDETSNKGIEFLTLVVTENPIDFRSILWNREGKIEQKAKDEILLLMKGSPLSNILNLEKKDSSFMISTVSFIVLPTSEKHGFYPVDENKKTKAAFTYMTKDSTEIFESPTIKEVFNRNDFPVIAFIDPGSTAKQISDSLAKMNINKIVLKGFVFDEQNGIKEITINGKKPSSFISANGLFEFKYTLQDGVNELYVIAENNIGNKKSYRLKFNYKPIEKQKEYIPQNYLLAVGINAYKYWPTLRNSRTDAERFKNLIIDSFGYKKENVIEVFDEKATFSELVDQFKYLIQVVNPEDNLLVYYAGHGMYEEMPPSMGYWVTTEAMKNESTTFFSNLLLGHLIREMKANSIFIISDACYSGALFDEATKYSKSFNTNYKTRLVLTSGGYDKVPDKSIFAEKILSKLSSPGTKEITAKELIAFIKNEFVNSSQKPTGGVLVDSFDEDGDFIFIKK